MHGLKVPHDFSRGCAQRDDRAGVAVFTEPHPAEVIWCWTGRWKEHEIALGIGDNHGPDVGRAGEPGGAVLPCLEGRIGRVLRYRIERPLERSITRVECAHLAARRRQICIVRDRRSRDDEVAHDRRRRRHLIERELVRRDPEPLAQIDHAVRAEVRARGSGGGVESEKSRVDRRGDDPPGA